MGLFCLRRNASKPAIPPPRESKCPFVASSRSATSPFVFAFIGRRPVQNRSPVYPNARSATPTLAEMMRLIGNALNVFTTNGEDSTEVHRACDGLSYAEIARACTEAAKAAILTDRRDLSTNEIQAALGERQAIRQQ